MFCIDATYHCTLRNDLKNYSCIGGCLVAQNTVAEIWSNAMVILQSYFPSYNV